ncbi:ATP-binding protein [Rhodococcus oxybenzonivorans]|uniref:histidine kinase n=1 Tax=Rhodococcus oxybenzonivorans TaxID=1990687 RepID=A0A2S2BRA8_9NOCA|nr:sensor histidine kinase [Rhodococcus oxybenzonivorans]AWK71167.1 ATP-binding protein [Rhodococcus oxybenzonivorans]
MSVARQLFLLQLAVLTLVIAAGTLLAVLDQRRDSDDSTRRAVTAVATALALSDGTVAALRTPDPSAILQPQTERIRTATGTDFIVVMAPDRTRFTHTSPELIGGTFSGNIERALAGETFTETYAGSLGPSIRAVAPIYDGGRIVGLVSVGVTREKIGDQVAKSLPTIFAVAAIGLVVSAAGSFLLSRRLRRQTLGMAPDELRRMYEHHAAVLHSIGEGLVVLGRTDGDDATAEVVNDEARRLLDLPDGPVPVSALPPSLRTATAPAPSDTGEPRDEIHLTTDRVLLVSREPVEWEGQRIGTVLTLRDRTEMQSVMGELDSVRGFAESLRSQAHESANRLHTIITMVELGRYDDAIAFATDDLRLSQELIDRLMTAVHEPALAALLLGKVGVAAERGVDLIVTEDTALGPVTPLTARELVTLVGNLVDNAIDAARGSAEQTTDGPWVEVTVCEEDSSMVVRVADSGPGIPAEVFDKAVTRGYSTKSGQRGLGLALVVQVVTRHGGTIRTEPSLGSMIVVEIPIAGAPS